MEVKENKIKYWPTGKGIQALGVLPSLTLSLGLWYYNIIILFHPRPWRSEHIIDLRALGDRNRKATSQKILTVEPPVRLIIPFGSPGLLARRLPVPVP